MLVIDARAEFQGGYTAFRTSTDALMVHHAAGLYPTETALEDVRAVARYHTVDRGWPGIGYHEVLAEARNGGEIVCYTCSNPNLQRAHVLNLNHRFFGISCLTNFNLHQGGVPEQKWIDALAERLRYWRTVYGPIPIVGHKERTVPGGETDCPGRTWYQWKGELLARTAAGGAPAQPAPAPPGVKPRKRYVVTHNGVAIRNKPGTYGEVMYRLNAGATFMSDFDNHQGTAVVAPSGVTTRTWAHVYKGGYASAAYLRQG